MTSSCTARGAGPPTARLLVAEAGERHELVPSTDASRSARSDVVRCVACRRLRLGPSPRMVVVASPS